MDDMNALRAHSRDFVVQSPCLRVVLLDAGCARRLSSNCIELAGS